MPAAPTTQTDLFDLDSPLYNDVPGEDGSRIPFFSLAKTPQMEPMTFQSEASPRSLAKFKRQLLDIAESDTLPQYYVKLRDTGMVF